MSKRYITVLVLLTLALSACVKDSESTTPAKSPLATFKARFVPLGGIMPFPNDLYFNGSTDGTLNIPVADATNTGDPLEAINHLDGFSTQAQIDEEFTSNLDAATVVGGKDVIVLQVTTDPATTAVTGVTGALVPGTDYNVAVAGNVLQIKPLKPLAGSSSYMVILTTGIKDTSGATAVADDSFQEIKDAILPVFSGGQAATLSDATLDGIKQLTLAQFAAAAGTGVDVTKIILSWTFSTQSIGSSLDAVEAKATAGGALVQDTGLNTAAADPRLSGHAEIYAGLANVPYYLDASKPLTGFWHAAGGGDTTRYNPMPVKTATEQIPVLLTVPDASSAYVLGGGSEPATGWPVVIFQHGITRNRTDMLAIADAFADAGFAVIAIDMPLHGITDTTSPLYVAGHERTFDLDVENNDTGAAGADGKIDPSGSHFINLTSLLTSRDNLRESVADLISLTKTIPTIDLNGDTIPDLDGSRIYFVGHSLGAIVGTTYLGVDSTPITGTLAMPGGHITQLLEDSPTFAPVINAGLAQEGLTPGTRLYSEFFRNAQTVIDTGDPANYAATAAANHPIHMIEVVGSTGSPPDQVVPNSATDLLVNLMGLTQISGTTVDTSGIRGVVRFLVGDHGSILDPTASMDATVEMQTETVVFAAGYAPATLPGNGSVILINNPSVVK